MVVTYFSFRRYKNNKRPNEKVYKDVPEESKPELLGNPVAQLEARENEVHVERQELDGRRRSRRADESGGEVWEMPGDEPITR